MQAKEYLAIYAADRVRNVSAVWMGATVGCAQCHDHKFDPYTAKDFYSLAAFFADVDEEKHLRGGGADADPDQAARRRSRSTPAASASASPSSTSRSPQLGKPTPTSGRSELAALKKERDALKKAQRLVMVTQAVDAADGARPAARQLARRHRPGRRAGGAGVPGQAARSTAAATRLDLANWLTDAKAGAGGLTARVFVNRLWYLFFGAGLSKSLDDFGGQGEPPVHPELLDNLAVEFVESGWDVKHVVKLIVTSRAYRQSSLEPPALAGTRPGEPAARPAGRGGGCRPRDPRQRPVRQRAAGPRRRRRRARSRTSRPGYYRHLNFPKREYAADTDAKQWRRGVYVHWQRQYLHPMLKAFDAPTREECTAQRPRSNTPLAALVLLNDPTFVEAARVLAPARARPRAGRPTPSASRSPSGR